MTSGSDNIDIANPGMAGESGTIRIGSSGKQTRTFLQGVYGSSVTGRTVVVNSSGRLGTAPGAMAATGEGQAISRMRAELRRQQREIERLREEVRRSG